jgi:hypothetical protein
MCKEDIVPWAGFIRMLLTAQNILQILFEIEICGSSKTLNNSAEFLEDFF